MSQANDIHDNLAQWQHDLRHSQPDLDHAKIARACEWLIAHSPITPLPFATSAISQGIQMSNTILTVNNDTVTVIATLCYPTIYYHDIAPDDIDTALEASAQHLIHGAERMEAINDFGSIDPSKLTHQQTDNLRKMLLAMVDDIRVVLIKLAERITLLHNIKEADDTLKQTIAIQTQQLYAPLANRLGIGELKWQLEDLAFRYTQKALYFQISKSLKMRRIEREEYINTIKNTLIELLAENNIKDSKVDGRAKHIYSIYKKTEKKHVDFSEIYDASAFRIRVPSEQDCYKALSAIHSHWPHIPQEFDDYIAKPKSNGYQSIHTALQDGENNIEIQIRTNEMHHASEQGGAAHWQYKEGGSQSSYSQKINALRHIMDWQHEVSQDSEHPEKSDIFDDRIYVFSPDGDVLDLPTGATALDFAYLIHTQVGHRCKGAKVNDKLVTIATPLSTGDQVHILTNKEGTPSRDWLDPNKKYITTTQAKNKIRHFFRQVDYQHHLEDGMAIWDKTWRRQGFKKSDLSLVYEHFNFKQPNDLLAALGAGDIGVASITHQLRSLSKSETPESAMQDDTTIEARPASQKPSKSSLTIEGEDNLLTQFGLCCKPIPGDDIKGFITKGHGITIHKSSCENIIQAIRSRPERILDADWGSDTDSDKYNYPVSLKVHCHNRAHLLRDISSVLSENKTNILQLYSHVDKKNNLVLIELTVEVKNTQTLKQLLAQLKGIDDITYVTRS